MDTITSLPPIAAIGIAVLVGIVLIALNYGWLIAARDKFSAQQRERLRMEDERRQEMTAARESLDEALSKLRRHVHGEPEGEQVDGQTLGTSDQATAPPAETPGPRERAGAATSPPRETPARPDERRPEP